MSKVLVRWNKPNVMSVATGRMDSSVVMFKPGLNELKKEQWDLVKDHPTVIERLKKKFIDPKKGEVVMLQIIVEGKKAPEAPKASGEGDEGGDSTIAELNVKDASALVKETYDAALLRSWAESESRGKVSKAIEKQLEAIEADRDEAPKDEDSQE